MTALNDRKGLQALASGPRLKPWTPLRFFPIHELRRTGILACQARSITSDLCGLRNRKGLPTAVGHG